MKWTLILYGKILRKRSHLFTSKNNLFDPDQKIKIQISDYIFESKLYPEVPFKGAVKLTLLCYFKLPKSLTKKEKQERLERKWAFEIRKDLDNIIKLYADCLQYGQLESKIFIDDHYICQYDLQKIWIDDDEDYLEIRIEDL